MARNKAMKVCLWGLFGIALTACSGSRFDYILKDRKFSSENWTVFNGVETSEEVVVMDHQLDCRHVIDDKPSFGGIVTSKPIKLKAGAEYEVAFKVKVVRGLATFQVLEQLTPKLAHFSYNTLIEKEWTAKRFRFVATVNSDTAKIDFTNSHSDQPGEFYIDDFYFREVPLWQRTFKSGEML